MNTGLIEMQIQLLISCFIRFMQHNDAIKRTICEIERDWRMCGMLLLRN